jgi:ABC-type antimicrobial peptide transport system permease subunit
MLKNYFLITFRSLSRNIFYVLINIIGMGLALAVCIVAYLNNKYDADFDKYNSNAKKIFKIESERPIQERPQWYGITPFSLGPLVKNDISGVEEVVRVQMSNSPVKLGEKNFSKRIAWCDLNFFKVFTIKMISGSSSSFSDKNTIFLDEELADIYFGDENPIGKIISVFADSEEERTFLVGGVFEKLPLNSSFIFQAITSIDNFIEMWNINEHDWKGMTAGTFLYLSDPSKVSAVEELLQQYIPVQNDAREDFKIEKFRLVPLTKMAHMAWDIWSNWFRQSLHPAAVTAPPVMAIFILLIACFNFMNTAIAFSSRRLKEIGIRKVAGSKKIQIIGQFMGEYFLLSLLSIILAVFFGRYLVSLYSSMWEYLDISLSFREYPELWILLPLLLIITTLLAGAYPSFYISRFNPVYIFQDKLKIGSRNILSKILLTLQFMISVLALVSGIIFSRNARFQDNIYLGYDKDNIIAVPIRNHSHFIAFRDAVRTNPKIESVGESEEHIGNSSYNRSVEYQNIRFEVQLLDIGDDYFKTMGLKLSEGREFPPELAQTDKENSIIINKKFVEEFGIQNPVGQRIMMDDTVPLNIVGVMENIYLWGIWSKIEPMILRRGYDARMRTLAVRASEKNLKEVNQFLEDQWQELVPNYPYSGFFQDDLMEEGRDINRNIKYIYIFLAFIATILSAIGLYTLVSLSIIRRTKEVGIRKVMGATIPRIFRILNREYLIILIIAAIGGSLSGYWLSNQMMDSIWDVFTDVTVFTFLVPVILIFGVATATMSWKIYAAASRNPTDSLRYE